MSKILKQTTSYILTAILVFSVFAGLTVTSEQTANAASYPTGYPNTYKNTGIGATDIVGVARTQIGYQENSAGTKYGYWYNTYFVNQPWCAMFVSWCANQARIPQTVITKFAACSVGISWFKSQKRWYDSKYFGGSYTPKKGDIVFYSDSGNQSDPSHVGLVAGLNGNYLDVIEGNATNSSVCEYTTSSSRSLSSSYVIGYGHPNYSTQPVEEPTTHEVWQVSVGTLNMRKSASTSATIVARVPFGGEIKVSKVKPKDDYVWGYATYGSKTGWVALDYCDYIFGSINGVYYQLRPTVSPTTKTLYVGYTATLTKTNALGGTFTSSDKTIAKVNSNGKITAVKAGKAVITLKTATGTSTCNVTVKNPTLSKTATACVGDSCTLSVKNTKLTPTWSSANTAIAKVNSKGKVTAVKEGVVNITAKVGDVSLKCSFTVTKYPTIYENFKTKCDTYLKNNCTDLKSVAKVPKGTTLKINKVYYTSTWSMGYTSYSGKTGWIILNKCTYLNGSINGTYYYVKPYLAETAKTIYLQDIHYIKVLYAGAKTTFTSADAKIARVTDKGKLRGVKAGTTTINVKSDSTTLKFKVVVKNPVLSKKSVTLIKGNKEKLTVTGGSGTITWASSDKAVAEVSASGEITAKGYGTATITAVRNGVTLSCKVTVFDPKLNATYKVVRVNQTKTLKVLQSSGAAVTWKSANSKLVKVNSKGEITGVKIGKTTVTATVDGVTLVCEVKIVRAAS